jgi:hypothetical protein
MFNHPFQPNGASCLIAANSSAPSGVQLVGDTGTETIGRRQYRVSNASNMTVYYATGTNASLAASAAIIPTNASVGGGHPLPAGATEVITMKTGLYWSAITATNFAGQVFTVTPGNGI